MPEFYRHGSWGFSVAGPGGCTIHVPYMNSYGGNMVVIAPTDLIGIRFSDSNNNTIDGMVTVLQMLVPFACP